jgi:single-strand DNA-binding protein
MSSDMILVGNLTKDPELRFAASGKPHAHFSVAVNKGSEDKGNKTSHFFDVVCFGDFAENMAELPKGTRVILSGYLEQKTWDDKDTGKKRSKLELIANDGGPSVRFQAVTSKGAASDKPAAQKQPDMVQDTLKMNNEEPF